MNKLYSDIVLVVRMAQSIDAKLRLVDMKLIDAAKPPPAQSPAAVKVPPLQPLVATGNEKS